jgi:Malectin domain
LFIWHTPGGLYDEQAGLRQWSADNYFTGGSTYSLTSVPVENTVDDVIYQTERLGTFTYSIPVPIGTFDIKIHLAEV